jgi:hypothetical protein
MAASTCLIFKGFKPRREKEKSYERSLLRVKWIASPAREKEKGENAISKRKAKIMNGEFVLLMADSYIAYRMLYIVCEEPKKSGIETMNKRRESDAGLVGMSMQILSFSPPLHSYCSAAALIGGPNVQRAFCFGSWQTSMETLQTPTRVMQVIR